MAGKGRRINYSRDKEEAKMNNRIVNKMVEEEKMSRNVLEAKEAVKKKKK
jgi:hypothetical protein